MNIVITGKSGSGKTTAVHRLLKYCRVPIYGFYTHKLPAEAAAPVYLHSFREPLCFSESNLIGYCKEQCPTAFPQVFDTLGVEILREIPEGAFVVLDEIGVMENKAELFQQELFRLLDSDCPVLITVRDKHTPLLDAIRSHPRAKVFTPQQVNVEETAAALAAQLQQKDRKEWR